MYELLLKGLIIGFAIAAPIGPIALLCIQRSLSSGFKIGLMTGVGAAFADGVCGLITGLGLTTIASLLITYQFWIRIIGGTSLLYLGVTLMRTLPREPTITENQTPSLWRAGVTAFFLTATNPMTILSFVAVFAALGLGSTASHSMHAILLVIGITVGSFCWWLLLSSGVAFILRHRISHRTMRIINFISGGIIVVFALLALSVLI